MEERFVIKRKDFKKLERYAENIYNTAVVSDSFCSSQKEYEELYNLASVVRKLRRDVDQINAFFINYPESIDEQFHFLIFNYIFFKNIRLSTW